MNCGTQVSVDGNFYWAQITRYVYWLKTVISDSFGLFYRK